MKILGISCFYHDAAAALLCDGQLVAAAHEERFTRKRHDPDVPAQAVAYCLREAGIQINDLDYLVFYDKPFIKLERILTTYLATFPKSLASFTKSIPIWMKEKLWVPTQLREHLGYEGEVLFAEHHQSHAASAFLPSPFEEAAILTCDGVGEWATTTQGIGRGNKFELTREVRFPHSLGLLYSAFTYYLGFKVNSAEYKVMGAAPYGEPKYADKILDELVDLRDDGSFKINMRYFAYDYGLTMTSRHFDKLFGEPRRESESKMEQFHWDMAASIQKVTEEIVLRIVNDLHASTGMKNLCMAGGVALNCVANGRLLREGPFENIWIQPAAGDAGGALGVAQFIWHQLLDKPRTVNELDDQSGSLLGPRFDNNEVQAFLDKIDVPYRRFDDEAEICDFIARQIANEKVVGWMQGRMEFGPRALGSRSILGDARSENMQKVMNLKIKFRESFRPFAPSVLQERVGDYFEFRPNEPSPYMLLVADVVQRKRAKLDGDLKGLSGLDILNVKRSEVPAITHVDYSARVQTVDKDRNGRYYKLIKQFEEVTGCPVIINTSFNVRGEPIVCTPQDAYHCFMGTEMDVLVIEDYVLLKEEQPEGGEFDRKAYLSQFALD